MNPCSAVQHSLKIRIILGALSIFLVGVWSVWLYTSRTLREDMEVLLSEQQFATVSRMAAEADDQLSTRLKALQDYVEVRLPPILLDNPVALQKQLDESLLIQSLFNGGVIVYRSEGTAIAEFPVSARRVGVNYMDVETVAAALQEGRANIGQPVTGKILKMPVFGMTVPVRDDQGKIIGALAGVVNLGLPNFLDSITKYRYGRTGDFLLVARESRLIVTTSDKQRIMEKLPAAGVNPGVDRSIGGYEGSSVFVNPHGVEILNAAKGIPSASWILVSILPTAEAFAPIHSMLRTMLYSTAVLTVLAAALMWWLLNRQFEPLVTATKAVTRLSNPAAIAQPLPNPSSDEVGELIGGFNHLLETLRQRERSLRQSEERYQRAVDGANDGIWEWIPATGEDYLSPRWKWLLGYEDHELPNIQESFFNHVHPDDRAHVSEAVRAHLEDRRPFEVELRLRCKNGEYRWFTSRGQADWDIQGQPLRMAGSISDITERKRVEAVLRDAQERMRAILDMVADPIFVKDNDHRIVLANPAFYEIFGLKEDGVIGKTLTEHVPEGERQHFLAVDRHVLDSGAPDTREESLTVAGVARTIITKKTRLIDDSGNRFLVGSISDITEIKESSLFNESLLKTIQFPINIVDSTGKVLYMNTQMERLVGRRGIDEKCWMLYRDNKQQCSSCPLTTTVWQGQTAKVESSGVFGGKTFEIQHTAMPYQGKEAILEIFLDTTERKHIEEQTAERNKELKELYASLLTARETERQRLARELHDDLGQRVTALRMDVDWIEAKLPPATPSLTAKMATVGPQIDDLVDAIRRLIEDMRPGMLDTLGLNAALDDYVAKFVTRTGIKCDLSFGPEDSTVTGDVAIGIFRIVQEALNNVQKYAEASRVSLTLLQKGDSISLLIEDDGIGFPETPNAEATGFGLRGMHERVAILGGRLSIASETGQGVRIEAVIPI